VNDNPPEFADDYRPVVYENQPPSQSVVTISAVDRDSPANGPPFEFWLPCHGACCDENPTCDDFDFTFIPSEQLIKRFIVFVQGYVAYQDFVICS